MPCSFLKYAFTAMVIVVVSSIATLAANEQKYDDAWPRSFNSEGTRVTIHEPQIDSWDGFNLRSHAAVAVKRGKQEESYGVVNFSALTLVDKSERMVKIEELRIENVNFPSIAEQTPVILPILERAMVKKVSRIGLDNLEAVMAVSNDTGTINAINVKNPVPKIIFAQKPTVLVYIDGEPKYAPVEDSDGSLWRVINTRVFLLRDASGRHYLHLYDGFMESPKLDGLWTVVAKPSAKLKRAVNAARKQANVDLLEGERDQKTNALSSLVAISPDVYMATQPTELLITDGEPNFAAIAGTQLLYVTNSTGSIFRHLQDNKTYILISGRWFRAASSSGPWEFVAAKDLPPDFAKIPDESPKENIKASVPGTPQAREALVANEIPQTAKVYRNDSRFTLIEFDGAPQLAPIEGTTLSYVVNCATPVIMVDYQTWYALENGVWFIAFSLDGPWSLADSVHPAIYTIPPSSPLHYVTYVKIYKVTPQYVYVGYTPGYLGTVVSNDVIVYGTGYYYAPWVGTAWYAPPITYGMGASIAWTPWAGWGYSFGFGIGWGWGGGWYYPPSPWWGPYYYRSGYYGHNHAWGPGGWAHTTGNYYHRGYTGHAGSPPYRSSGAYGNAYNSRHGSIAAGQRGTVQNVFRSDAAKRSKSSGVAGRSKQTVPGRSGGSLFGTREGKVYKPSRQGNWEAVNATGRKSSGVKATRDFSREQHARQTGQQRNRSFQDIPRSARLQTAPSGGSFSRQGGFPSGGRGAVSGGGYSRGAGASTGGSPAHRGGDRR